MKTYKKVQKELTVLDTLICDICGEKGNTTFGWGDGWIEHVKSSVECSIELDDLRGSGSRREIEFDICPKCFEKHLVPVLNSFMDKPKKWVEEEW